MTQLGICYLLDVRISYEHNLDLMYLGICYLLDERIYEHNLGRTNPQVTI